MSAYSDAITSLFICWAVVQFHPHVYAGFDRAAANRLWGKVRAVLDSKATVGDVQLQYADGMLRRHHRRSARSTSRSEGIVLNRATL